MVIVLLLIVLILELIPYFTYSTFLFSTLSGQFALAYFSVSVLSYFGLIRYLYSVRYRQKYYAYWSNILVSFGFSWIVGKLILLPLIGFSFGLSFLAGLFNTSLATIPFLMASGFVFIGFILFLVYGVAFGKYHYKIRTVQVKIKNLPKEFVDFKIVQISDAHLGTFDSLKGFKKGISAIVKTNPDLLLFTGDLVNNVAEEAIPYINYFKNIEARFGKFAILGNHDYADYVQWDSAESKKNNLQKLKDTHQQMGFGLLDNEHVELKKNGASIFLAGVENWGLPPFPQHGNLKGAIDGIPKNAPTILMSHDPSHWDAEVKNHPHFISLTLSGHTHGMQFGIDLPFFKWSPVKFKYPKWAGLYSEEGKHLYVNRGFGFLGFPGRAGIRPEITELILG